MKRYNVKQAASGIQGQMDQSVKNQTIRDVMGDLTNGYQGRRLYEVNKQQYNDLTGEDGALQEQINYFEGLKTSGDKFEKLLANESLLKLGVLKAGLTPFNIGDFGKNYKDMFSGGSLFEPLAGIERAKLIAGGMSERNKIAAEKAQTEEDVLQRLNDIANREFKGNKGFNPLQGIGNLFSGIGSKFGMGAPVGLGTISPADFGADIYEGL